MDYLAQSLMSGSYNIHRRLGELSVSLLLCTQYLSLFFISVCSLTYLSLPLSGHVSLKRMPVHGSRSVKSCTFLSVPLVMIWNSSGVVTYNTEQGVGQDHLIPHKPPGWETRRTQTNLVKGHIKQIANLHSECLVHEKVVDLTFQQTQSTEE